MMFNNYANFTRSRLNGKYDRRSKLMHYPGLPSHLKRPFVSLGRGGSDGCWGDGYDHESVV